MQATRPHGGGGSVSAATKRKMKKRKRGPATPKGRSVMPIGPTDPGRDIVPTESKELLCKICKIKFTSENQQAAHLQGKKHKRKAVEMNANEPAVPAEQTSYKPPRKRIRGFSNEDEGEKPVLGITPSRPREEGVVEFIDHQTAMLELKAKMKKRARKLRRLERKENERVQAEKAKETSKRSPAGLPTEKKVRAKDPEHLMDCLSSGVTLGPCAECKCKRYAAHEGMDGASDPSSSNQFSDWTRSHKCEGCSHPPSVHMLNASAGSEGNSNEMYPGFDSILKKIFLLVKDARVCAYAFKNKLWVTLLMQELTEEINNLVDSLNSEGGQQKRTKNNKNKKSSDGSSRDSLLENIQKHLEEGLEVMMQFNMAEGNNTGKPVPSLPIEPELVVNYVCAIDGMYYWLYNYASTAHGRENDFVPNPARYFSDIAEPIAQQLKVCREELFEQEVDALTREGIPDTWGADDNNALMTLYKLKFDESAYLFYRTGLGMQGQMDDAVRAWTKSIKNKGENKKNKNKNKKKKQKKHHEKEETEGRARSADKDPPCYPLLQQWRDNCRDWVTHIFAYAVPNNKALECLAKHAPLMEIGAGTGYWASLLRARNVDITCYDVHPSGGKEWNEYHGALPSFTDVLPGGPDKAANTNKTLFLCYPPPESPMAVSCLEPYTGNTVIYVGEWQGDTATTEFEVELCSSFKLVERIPLPNWSNTAYELTVWRRKKNNEEAPEWPDAIFHCSNCNSCDKELRRCVYCALACYCSKECEEAHRIRHNSIHAMHTMYFTRALDFESMDYLAISP